MPGIASLSNESLNALLQKFQGKRLLVIGDFIVSRFVEVSARKLAREAPVPAGDYVGETLLPIPEKAPPGKYRIVSKLVTRAKNQSSFTVLSKTNVSFQIVP